MSDVATDTGQPLHSSPAERLISSQSLTSENLGLESFSHTVDSTTGEFLCFHEILSLSSVRRTPTPLDRQKFLIRISSLPQRRCDIQWKNMYLQNDTENVPKNIHLCTPLPLVLPIIIFNSLTAVLVCFDKKE